MRAEDGNIVLGDIIVAVDGKPVKTIDDLLTLLEQHMPGDTLSIRIARGGDTVDAQITLGQRD
jgi:S1-C subfamily serine protease